LIGFEYNSVRALVHSVAVEVTAELKKKGNESLGQLFSNGIAL
jgi:hypothetical protein